MARKIVFALVLTVFFFFPRGGLHGAESPALRINCTYHGAYEVFFFRLVEEI